MAEYEYGWERYDLDSLAADELSQLPYEPGFGSIKISDDNGSSTLTTLNDFRGANLESDWEIDDFDDDFDEDFPRVAAAAAVVAKGRRRLDRR